MDAQIGLDGMVGATPPPSRFPWVRAVLLTAVCILLLGLILRHGLVAYLAERDPEWALSIRANAPAAIVALADRRLNSPEFLSAGEATRQSVARSLEPLLKKAILEDPLNPRAFRLLGQIADVQKHPDAAELMMREATRLSISQSRAAFWLMRRNFERRNYSAAAYYADAALRSQPQLMKDVIPVLGVMAGQEQARPFVVQLLVAAPAWRSTFFAMINEAITDARTPFNLMIAMKDQGYAPTAEEVRFFLDFLVKQKLYPYAYEVWLEFLSPEEQKDAGFLFNGGFESKPSGVPFDWAIRTRGDVDADIVKDPDADGKPTLRIDMGPGRTENLDVSQMVVLAPGAYRFKGMLRGNVVGPRGPKWLVTCAGTSPRPISLGESKMAVGDFPEPRSFEFAFSVPEVGCQAQIAKLTLAARSASEQLASGIIYYSDVAIVRDK